MITMTPNERWKSDRTRLFLALDWAVNKPSRPIWFRWLCLSLTKKMSLIALRPNQFKARQSGPSLKKRWKKQRVKVDFAPACHVTSRKILRCFLAQTGQPLPQNRLSGDVCHSWPHTMHFHQTFLLDRAGQFCGAFTFFS